MPEIEPKRARAHNAEAAREAILNAAEVVFTEHGFDGARIDSIASASGYNKSLIFQYFGDKLGLYAEVVRRAEKQIDWLQGQMLAALEKEAASDPQKFKQVLKQAVGAFFDYLVENPRFLRILNWEMAEGWQTLGKIFSQRDLQDAENFRPVLEKMQREGLLRPGLDPLRQVAVAVYTGQYYLGSLPLYQIMSPGKDLTSADELARTREFLVDFVVRGLIMDPSEKNP